MGLRTAEHYERIAELGFEIPETLLGHRARVSCYVVADAADDAGTKLTQLINALDDDSAASIALVLATGEAGVSVLLPAVRKSVADTIPTAVLPMKRPAGDRTRDDIVGAACLSLVCLTAPAFRGDAGPLRGLLRSTHVLGAAFVDAASDEFLGSVRNVAAAKLLRMQFENIKTFEPAQLFDELGRTELNAALDWTRLAERMADGTPYIISKKGHNLGVALPRAEFALNLHDVPMKSWPQAIRSMRQLMRYSSGREWRERLEENAAVLTAGLTELARRDCERLHAYERATDRVLAWREQLLARLKQQPSVLSRSAEGFESSLKSLEVRIAEAPPRVSLWVQCSLAALFASGAAFVLGGVLRGAIAAVAASVGVAVAVLAVGALYLHSKEENVRRARDRALDALVGTFEEVAASNLETLLDRLKVKLEAAVESEAEACERLAAEYVGLADELEARAGGCSAAVDVKPVVEPDAVPAYLDGLHLPWSEFLARACRESVLTPVRSHEGALELAPERPTDFASQLLAGSEIDVSFTSQLASGNTDVTSRITELLDDLVRRSDVGDPTAATTLVRPGDLDEALLIGTAEQEEATLSSADLGIFGCLRAGRILGEGGTG